MSNKLGNHDFDAIVGTRDAFHVPIVVTVCSAAIHGGDWVRFVSEEGKEVERCERSQSHGIADPFIHRIAPGLPFYVLLSPGMVKSVRHTFDLDFKRSALERQLEEQQEADPDCAECWAIDGDQLIRY